MQFAPYEIYLFTTGNQLQPVFLNNENYLYFLSKLHYYIVPVSDILAWCLMPNHFHLLLHTNEVSVAGVKNTVIPLNNFQKECDAC